ncbi:hypothetical protein C6P43_004410 [Kluyveromyces marxianus]|nr:hypothetical protein C6P43_004410 [Kluyveromyces marxianus]
MDAGLAAARQQQQQRPGAGVSAMAQRRNELLHSDIGNIDITKENPIKKENVQPPVPVQQQYQQQYQYQYPQQQQQQYQQYPGQYVPQGPTVSGGGGSGKYGMDNERKSSMMSTSSTSFSNFFKGKNKKNKRNSRSQEAFDDRDDDGADVVLPENNGSFLTFNDISSMRNNGGHAYGYGGHMDDTSPIIPTLVTSGGNASSMNNVEYRKHMVNQKKMALNSLAKQQAPPGVPGGPRAMSLQTYHQRPMVRPGPGPGPGPAPGPRGPPGGVPRGPPGPGGAARAGSMPMPNGSRLNSLQGGGAPPPRMMGRPGPGPGYNNNSPHYQYPQGPQGPQGPGMGPGMGPGPGSDPRTMSLTTDRRPMVPMGPMGPMGHPNGYGPLPPPQGGPRNGFGPRAQRGPPQSGPRAMSLQSQSVPRPFYSAPTASQDNVLNRKQVPPPVAAASRPLAPPQQLPSNTNGKGTSNSSSGSYASTNSVISGRVSENSSPTTPSNASSEEQNQIPALPRSPLKYELHASVADDDVSVSHAYQNRALHSFNEDEEDEDQQTFIAKKDLSQAETPRNASDADSLIKLNILTLSKPARQVMDLDDQNGPNRHEHEHATQLETPLSETKSNHSETSNYNINLKPSSALVEGVPTDADSLFQFEKIEHHPPAHTRIASENPYNDIESEINGEIQDIGGSGGATASMGRVATSKSGSSDFVDNTSEFDKSSRRSSSNFQKAKNFLLKIKGNKGHERKTSAVIPSSSRSSIILDDASLTNDTFKAKTSSASSDKRRRSYHSLFSSSSLSAGNPVEKENNATTSAAAAAAAMERPTRSSRSSTSMQLRKSLIISESTQIQEEPEEESPSQQSLQGAVPYTPSYASVADPKQRVLITPEHINLLKQNSSLIQELQLVSTELAESIARETRLESELESRRNLAEPESPSGLSFIDFETELRKKSSKIVELIQQLNEERLKRFIAEEQNLLYQHGIKPAPAELSLKITELKMQLDSKDQQLQSLQTQLQDLTFTS